MMVSTAPIVGIVCVLTFVSVVFAWAMTREYRKTAAARSALLVQLGAKPSIARIHRTIVWVYIAATVVVAVGLATILTIIDHSA